MRKTSSWIAAALLLVVVGTGALGQEATQTESLNIQLDGRKTWTIRYGFGDPLALSAESLSAGQLVLDQTMWVDFTARALSILRVEGHFDDQESNDMQSLSLYLDTENIQGVLGDFTSPALGSFFSGSRTMTGARADFAWSGGSATGIVSQLAGTRESREFVGEMAFGERTFAGERGEEGVTYSTSLEGFGTIELQELYVAGFTVIRLDLEASAVSAILTEYGVGELGACLEAFAGRPVDEREAVVVDSVDGGDDAQWFVLRVEPASLVRETIREAIRAYNKTGPATALAYPFVVGSEVEEGFLASLATRATLVVGEEVRTLGELRWRRFYDLGQEDVEADSVIAAVRLKGEYVATTDPRLEGYVVRVHAAAGLLEVSFPESFFESADAALRASFAYRVVGGTYFLGMSIIPASERVTLAGRVLLRDIDYSMDYEFGMLALLTAIGPEDRLAVEFERYSGPGGSGAYARTFYGATSSVPVGGGWSLTGYALRAADDPGSVSNPDSVRVMPNAQTVIGVTGRLSRPDLSADFDLGYTNDVFPYDDNVRLRTPNRVRAIAAAAGRVFVGTDSGFSAMIAGTWRGYDAGSGLSGREVRAVVADANAVYLGTEGGLTVVRLVGISPLDRVANWSRYGERDGLANASVRALVLDGDVLWVGTDGGLTEVPVAELGDPDAWTSHEHAGLVGIRAMSVAGGLLYVGTEDGLVRFDPQTAEVVAIGTPGAAVAALAVDGATVYAAGSSGVRSIVDGAETAWIIRDRAVAAVAVVNGELVYGTTDGLFGPSTEDVTYDGWAITALHVDGVALWIGSEGDGAGELLVWRRDSASTAYGSDTTELVPWNPRVYQDAPAGEHTTRGWMAQGAFAYQGEGYAIAGSVDRAFPGFRAIDARGRASAGGWSVASDIDLGTQATLSFDHEVRMSDPESASARATIDNRFAFRGSFGPEVSLGVSHRAEDTSLARPGYERNLVSYNVSVDHSMFEDALGVSVGWDETLHWDDGLALRRETALSTQATLELAPRVRTTVSWSRPVRVLGQTISGSERIDCTTKGTFDVAGFVVSGGYEMETAWSVPNGIAKWTHEGTFGVTAAAVELGAASLAPTLDFEARHADDATSLASRLGVRLGVAELTTRATASVDVNGLGTRVVRWTEKLTASATYAGIAGLRPSLNYSGTRNVTEVQDQGTKVTTSHSLNGRMTWTGPNGASETLSVAARAQSNGTGSVTLDNAFLCDITNLVGGWLTSLRKPQSDSATLPSDSEVIASETTESSALSAAAGSPAPSGTAGVASATSPTIMLRTDLGGEWRRQTERDDASWRVGAAVDVALSSTWSLSLGLTYRGGVRTAVDPFHGLVVEMTVAIDFKQ